MYLPKHPTFVAFGILILCVFALSTDAQGNESITEDDDNYRSKRVATLKGALYTRWGRTTCNYQSKLVYKGVVGGAHYTHQGSGSNYVCLPKDPVFDYMKYSSASALIYGTEYEFLDDLFNKKIHDHDAPCAVCQSTKRTNQMMIPGRNRCYPGWHAEYKGYLVAQYYKYAGKTEFVCLDANPETDHAGHKNENGALMHRVQGSCGSLPCPPYIEGKPLTCVVCTN